MLTPRPSPVQSVACYAPRAAMVRRRLLPSCVVALCGLLLPDGAAASGLSARFDTQIVTQGEDVVIEVSVAAPREVVARVQVELRRPDQSTWTATSAAAGAYDPARQIWRATYPAAAVWPAGPPPDVLEARALLYGRRGGLMLVVGEIAPYELDALPPALAEARRRALTRPAEPAAEGADVGLVGYIGAEGRLGSTARARVFLGIGVPVARGWEIVPGVHVGPTFDKPDDLGGGTVLFGAELGARVRTEPMGKLTLYAWPVTQVDLRLPGVDVGGGLRAGAAYSLGEELALTADVGGLLMLFAASAGDGDRRRAGFSGGLRVGIRFGPNDFGPEGPDS